jgi:UDP-N-acetylmuramate--alanine ligase
MHIYFSGIGGTGIGPLALIAHQAGYEVSGSDKQDSGYLQYLKKHGITGIHIGQSYDGIAAVHREKPIDWFVYTSALPIENPDAPELRFCSDSRIRHSKRDAFLAGLLDEKKLKLVAVAGTHGKTTTTAMAVWLFKQLGIPVSYSVGGKLSFGDMGEYRPGSEYFVYEADEFDRNFLTFRPHLSLITGIDWDHPDIYPTREDYYAAFRQFLDQSQSAILWDADEERLELEPADKFQIIRENDPVINKKLQLPGLVNRRNAWQVAHALAKLTDKPLEEFAEKMNDFPGVGRRFERIVPNLYSDYAHTPPKIRGALQMARETAGKNVVVVYEGLHNTRQHFIKDELKNLFDDVKKLYIVPSYLARENPDLKLLEPEDLKQLLSPDAQAHTEPMRLDENLKKAIAKHLSENDLVLCISAGGGNSLDEWIREEFSNTNE